MEDENKPLVLICSSKDKAYVPPAVIILEMLQTETGVGSFPETDSFTAIS